MYSLEHFLLGFLVAFVLSFLILTISSILYGHGLHLPTAYTKLEDHSIPLPLSLLCLSLWVVLFMHLIDDGFLIPNEGLNPIDVFGALRYDEVTIVLAMEIIVGMLYGICIAAFYVTLIVVTGFFIWLLYKFFVVIGNDEMVMPDEITFDDKD